MFSLSESLTWFPCLSIVCPSNLKKDNVYLSPLFQLTSLLSEFCVYICVMERKFDIFLYSRLELAGVPNEWYLEVGLMWLILMRLKQIHMYFNVIKYISFKTKSNFTFASKEAENSEPAKRCQKEYTCTRLNARCSSETSPKVFYYHILNLFL